MLVVVVRVCAHTDDLGHLGPDVRGMALVVVCGWGGGPSHTRVTFTIVWMHGKPTILFGLINKNVLNL